MGVSTAVIRSCSVWVTVIGAVALLAGCASRIAETATLQLVQEESGTFRMGLSLDDDRRPSKCEVVAPSAAAKIDDLSMRMVSPGTLSRGFQMSGATFSIPSCGPAGFTADGVPPRPDGEESVVRVQDGERAFELRAPNLRALVRAEPPAEVASGGRVTLAILPATGPAIRGANLSIYRGKEHVHLFRAADIEIQHRSLTFTIPALSSGAYRLEIGLGEEPVRVTSCLGARACKIDPYRSVPPIPLVVR
jgi:hypothetical protein